MTDYEIIKALECCSGENCNGCPYSNRKCHQGNPMIIDALDLTTRQKAEIEKLKKEKDEMHKDVIVAEEYAWSLKTAKSEAINDFAEKLKALIGLMNEGDNDYSVIFEYIDSLVKEMVGEDNA